MLRLRRRWPAPLRCQQRAHHIAERLQQATRVAARRIGRSAGAAAASCRRGGRRLLLRLALLLLGAAAAAAAQRAAELERGGAPHAVALELALMSTQPRPVARLAQLVSTLPPPQQRLGLEGARPRTHAAQVLLPPGAQGGGGGGAIAILPVLLGGGGGAEQLAAPAHGHELASEPCRVRWAPLEQPRPAAVDAVAGGAFAFVLQLMAMGWAEAAAAAAAHAGLGPRAQQRRDDRVRPAMRGVRQQRYARRPCGERPAVLVRVAGWCVQPIQLQPCQLREAKVLGLRARSSQHMYVSQAGRQKHT